MNNYVIGLLRYDDKIYIRKSTKNNLYLFLGGRYEYGRSSKTALKQLMKKKYGIELAKCEVYWRYESKFQGEDCHFDVIFCESQNDKQISKELPGTLIDYDEFKAIEECNWLPIFRDLVKFILESHKYMNTFKYPFLHERHGEMMTSFSKDSQTINIFDTFEGIKNHEKPYEKMIIINSNPWFIDSYRIKYNLILERLREQSINNYDNSMTISEFKENPGKVHGFCLTELKNIIHHEQTILKRKDIYFQNPYVIMAQNSRNRQGYGWEWSYGICTKYGTLYGETTDYGIVGVRIKSVEKIAKK